MKKALLIVLLFVIGVSNGQTTITALNGILNTEWNSTDGQDFRTAVRFDASSSFSQEATGPNQVWDISGFTQLPGTIQYTNTMAGIDVLMDYPGTILVSTATASSSLGSYFNNVSYGSGSLPGFTGFSDNELTLNYITNNINLGSFPKTYGSSYSDTVAGNYVFGMYEGTFTGTFTTAVDAYGTMNSSADGIVDVTRVKTVENLQISYPGSGVVGTFVQTTYRYFRALDLWPYVKSTNREINIIPLELNTNSTTIEKANFAFLSVPNLAVDKTISIHPNPTTNSINVNSSQEINSLTVMDQLGKIVLTKNKSSTIDVSGLQSGIYFVKIVTDGGSGVKKFVKN